MRRGVSLKDKPNNKKQESQEEQSEINLLYQGADKKQQLEDHLRRVRELIMGGKQ